MLRVEKSQHTHTLGTPPTPTSPRVSLSLDATVTAECAVKDPPRPPPPDGGGWGGSPPFLQLTHHNKEMRGTKKKRRRGSSRIRVSLAAPSPEGLVLLVRVFPQFPFFGFNRFFRKLKQSHSIRQRFSPVSALWPEVWRTLLSLPSSSEVCGFTTKYKSAPTNHSRSISPAYVRVGWYLSAIFPTPSSRAHPLTHKNGLGASLSLLRFTARH